MTNPPRQTIPGAAVSARPAGRTKPFRRCLLMLVLATTGTGCSSLAYYGQAIGGHLEIMQRRQPIEEVVAAESTPPALRQRLREALAIREFASRELGLPDNASYRSYADLDRPYAVWNVIATPALSLEPRRWCFPVAGCLAYRGYFSEADAEEFAAELAGRGDDTYIAGVTAYSTLGWFADPVLNTMLRGDTTRLARIIFHELAHQRLYIDDDTAFNEAFAETVAIAGTRRWLQSRDDADALAAFDRRLERQRRVLELILTTRERLAALYARPIGESIKRRRKTELLAGLERDYRQHRRHWPGYDAYDGWFAGELNNARLAAVATYHRLVPDFMALLANVDHDLERFYTRVAKLAGSPPAERRRRLAECDSGG